MRKKVLVLCHDTVGKKMAGPGIRYQNLAGQVKTIASVTLAVFDNSKAQPPQKGIQAIKTTGESYKAVFDKHDVIFAQWLPRQMLQYANDMGKIVIIDLYAPVPIEYLASLGFSGKTIGEEKDLEYSGVLETYKQYLTLADYFVCSNERQRDFWIGFATSLNIIKPTNFNRFAKMDNIALAPMGISSTPPSGKSLKLRARTGIAKDDFVLLWTGGIWDWFDAKVIINAVALLKNPRVKLVFLGTQHPNTKEYREEMSESKAARQLAEELGLTNKSVFFLDGWVPYKERASYLLDADVAIHADKDSVETRLSHRTRVLDNLWAGLPTICSQGDYFAEVLENQEMGIIAKQRTPQAFAKAIAEAYDNPQLLRKIKSNIKNQQHNFTWQALSKDLLSFIKNPKPAHRQTAEQSQAQAPASSSLSRYSKVAQRRVRNAIRVLLGRVSV